ncbi:MAG: hypothetical protein RL701_2991 [Pseudomonadota bacterium]
MLRRVIGRSTPPRWRRFGALACVLAVASLALTAAAARRTGERELALLRAQRCEPLRVLDRSGGLLRALPAVCAAERTHAWTPLAKLPETFLAVVLVGEDRRFLRHFGVDPIAIVRAAFTNLRARNIVSGASTLSMQLAALLHPQESRHRLAAKWQQAWRALALERRASKDELLEAWANRAYYGAGAYGIAAAAHTYFGKNVAALSAGESALLAVLPRAPSAYQPRRHLERARARRDYLLAQLTAAGALSAQAARTVAAEPLNLTQPKPAATPRAEHFVAWVLTTVPEKQRLAGGVLKTTLDAELQGNAELAVREHVALHHSNDVTQAGVVVIDTQTGAVRAMVGSTSYAASQINVTTRRRHLGSLLKPFVYALAVEAGADAESIVLDVGDVPSEYRARDWVGREAGPLSYREALAGSYNLAAVHVLERVGVAALHERLRRAGVAELASAPASYGLPLALGSARVRLLDVAAGYGFLVRDGSVQKPYGVESLERAVAVPASFAPDNTHATALFSPVVSYRVMDMLSDAAARHRRFGRGLPLELADDARIVAKTGTASGMSDASAILASREFIVAAWSGRFDGRPTRGMSGMWGAAPLARRVLESALHGKTPTLPPRPAALANAPAAVGGHGATLARTPELNAWAERARALAQRPRQTRR